MSEQFESVFYSYQNVEIFYHIWKCPSPIATLLVSHGLAEHSECYKEFAEDLNKQKINVIVYDLRGHGRSEGKRGVVEDFEYLCKDLVGFTEYCQENYKEELPFFLVGHSLGGLITVKTLLTHNIEGIDGVLLSSPCLGLKLEIPTWKENLARMGAKWTPAMTMWNELKYEDLVRDVERARSYEADPLRHDKISPRLFMGMIESIDFVEEHEDEFSLPLLIQIAGNDNVCNPAAGIRFYENCKSRTKKIHIYEDSLHEVYNDLDREDALRDLANFVRSQIAK